MAEPAKDLIERARVAEQVGLIATAHSLYRRAGATTDRRRLEAKHPNLKPSKRTR